MRHRGEPVPRLLVSGELPRVVAEGVSAAELSGCRSATQGEDELVSGACHKLGCWVKCAPLHARGTIRVSHQRPRMPGLPDRLVSERTKTFESLGLVERTTISGPPLRVAYSVVPRLLPKRVRYESPMEVVTEVVKAGAAVPTLRSCTGD